MFYADEKNIISSSYDNSIKIWDIKLGKIQQTLKQHESYVESFSQTSEGKYIVSCSWDKTIKIWEN